MSDRTKKIGQYDKDFVWHPFTQMKEYEEKEPVIIEDSDGAYLIDSEGNRYIDGVSSLWVNVHGHKVTEIDNAIKETLDRFGSIDVVVNNAGYGVFGPIEAISRETMIRQFDVNVIGLMDVTKAIIPYFRNRGEGSIINITSVGGKITFPFISLYHGTKFAVEGISEAMYFEMQEIGCKVKIVEPGAIKTNFDQSMDINNDESITEYQELMQKLMAVMEPMLANGSEPEVVAEVIYEAATDGTDQLRYVAGEDAKEWIKNRKDQDDETFMAGIKVKAPRATETRRIVSQIPHHPVRPLE